MRAYTLNQIDAMRLDIKLIYQTREIADTEAYLGTVMLASVEPAELAERAEEIRARWREASERLKAKVAEQSAIYQRETQDIEPETRLERRDWYRRFMRWASNRANRI